MHSRQRRKVGDIVKIALGDGSSAYGLVLAEPLMAFYGINGRTDASIEDIEASPVLFKIWVMNKAVTSGRWAVIGNVSVSNDLLAQPTFFKVDRLTSEYSLVGSANSISATREDCIGLEAAAVWSASHVEDRLRDHFAGVSNKWVKSLAA